MKVQLILLMSFSLFFCGNKKPDKKICFEQLVYNKDAENLLKDSLFQETLVLISSIRSELIANDKQNGGFSRDFYCLITVVRDKYGEELN